MIEKFFYSQIHLVKYYCNNGRNNIQVISLIITEMYFTSSMQRVLEYFAFLILSPFAMKRIDRLSVGIAQIQIQHWKRYEYIPNRNKYSDIITLTNRLNNYDIVYALLSNNLKNNDDFVKLLATYRGEARLYHYTVFTTFYQLLKVTVANMPPAAMRAGYGGKR